jgi:hypothetical protein
MRTRNRVGIGLLYRPSRACICKPFKEPGFDSQLGGPVQQPYLLYRLARLHRLAESIHGLFKRSHIRAQAILASGIGSLESIPGSLNVYKYRLRLHWLVELVPWNRFLGSLNVYKYRLRQHWLAELVPWNQFLGSITWRTKTRQFFLDQNEYIRPSTIKGTKNNEFIRS